MIDIIYVIPAIAITVAIIFAYKLGHEVGRDSGRREQIARARHPAGRDRNYRTNVIKIK